MQTTTTTTKAKALNSVSFGISHTVDDIHALYRQAENPKNLFSSHFYWIYPSMPFLLKLSEHALPRDTIRARPSSWHYQSTPYLVKLSEHALLLETLRAHPTSWNYRSTLFSSWDYSKHALPLQTVKTRPSSWDYQSTPLILRLSKHTIPLETINGYPLESSSWNPQNTPVLWNYQSTPIFLKISKHTVSSWNYQRISSWKFFLEFSKHSPPLKLSMHTRPPETIYEKMPSPCKYVDERSLIVLKLVA